ncbi:MAG: hypothetical protein MUF40_06385 [Gemmatimonadaceae bacterium]|nr:hypothetical protein [Gemmatimonadaceae bacterium]
MSQPPLVPLRAAVADVVHPYAPGTDPAALLARYDRPGPRYTSYPPANLWRDDVGGADLAAALTRVAGRGAPVALYARSSRARPRSSATGSPSRPTPSGASSAIRGW